MNTTLSSALPSQIDTECLVVVVLDAADNQPDDPNAKPNPQAQTADKGVSDAATDLIASGEVTGKMLEATLLHKPQGLKAKRLLLLGGGKAKKFTSAELRKLAGAAVRSLKAKDLKTFTFVAPAGVDDAAKSIVEGAVVGNFDADYFRSDRKDQKIEDLTIITPKVRTRDPGATVSNAAALSASHRFTRDLVNQPGNRMTPTVMADRTKAMCKRVPARRANLRS